jgi:hypothetical protein
MDCRELYKPTEVCHSHSVCMLYFVRRLRRRNRLRETVFCNELSVRLENGRSLDFDFQKPNW